MNAERDNAKSVQTNMDYQFLVGHKFSVDDQQYAVLEIVIRDQRVFVEADTTVDGKTIRRQFPAATAIESLLVEEEIELFSPNFVFAVN